MTKEELIKFLSENLQIDVNCNSDVCGNTEVTVDLMLCGKTISCATSWG